MAFENIDPQRLQPMQHIHVPAIGGLDSISPKTQVQPGTLYDCLNYEVDLESGYKLSDGIALYTNRGFTLPAKFLTSTVDPANSVASLGDFFAGGIYKIADPTSGDILGELRYLGSNESGSFHYEIVKVEASAINEKINPELNDAVDVFTGDPSTSSNLRLDTFPQVNLAATTYLNRYKDVVQGLSTGVSGPPGQGPITGLFFFGDDLYAARTNSADTGSELYRSPDLTQITADPAWQPVDMGYEVEFKEGEKRPLTFYDVEFLEEQVDLQDPVIDAVGTKAQDVKSVASPSFAQGDWEETENVLEKSADDTKATTATTRTTGNAWKRTHRLEVTGFNIGEGITGDVEVVGIEVNVRHGHSTIGSINNGTQEARLFTTKLLGVGDTTNKAPNTTIDSADIGGALGPDTYFTTTMGGATDVWGASKLSTEAVFSDEFGVVVEFEHRVDSPANTTTPVILAHVPWITVTVHFTNATEKVFFWDGTADVAMGDIVNISLTESSFTFNTAKGWLALYNVDNPTSVITDLEIRSAANGAGSLLAKTAADMEAQELPTSTEMKEAESFLLTKTTNFFLDPDKIAVYGATAASPAFHYNGTHFWFIHTPVPKSKDKPRYIAKHQNHLVLSFDRGAILVSRGADPNTFSGLLGASSHEFDGKGVTGLLSLSGNALGVFTTNTVEALLGTSINNFTTQTIAGSGALNYTVSDVGQPLFTDFRGVNNLQAAQAYGDFNFGRVSQLISNDIQKRIQLKQDIIAIDSEVNFALPVKNKNQYRLFFKNGEIFTMSLFDAGQPLPMFTRQEFIPVEQGDSAV